MKNKCNNCKVEIERYSIGWIILGIATFVIGTTMTICNINVVTTITNFGNLLSILNVMLWLIVTAILMTIIGERGYYKHQSVPVTRYK